MGSCFSRNVREKRKNPKLMKKFTRTLFLKSYFQHQNWSFPDSIIYYIRNNPATPEVYQNLVQSCKYFFVKNPILVFANLYKGHMYQTFKIDDKCIKMDINKISSKLWIIRGLSITDESDPKYLNSLLLSKLYRCEFHDLVLRDQNISFEDFKFLASSAKKVTVMWGSIIKYKNEKIVMFDKIMECLPNIENLYFAFHDDSMINSEMMKNILKLKNFENLKNLSLYNIPESLSVKDISAFIKKYKNMKFWLIFCNISNEYKEQLDALVDEIIESGVPYRYLEYEEQDLEKETIMRNRYFKEHLQD